MLSRDYKTAFRAALVALVLAASVPVPCHNAQDSNTLTDSTEPRWRSHLVLWPKGDTDSAPWRNDPRMKGRFEQGYPDDIQVLFMNRAGKTSGKNEVMWVTIIDHDPKSDQFLGILINEPHYLRDVADRDNVVFHFTPNCRRRAVRCNF
jgi:hypothetical protein